MGSRRTLSVHEFYRYPARFSPDFARAVIEAFSRPGELVLDPFVGGGTTLVEARLCGRPAIGSDLNPLALFVSRAKMTLHSRQSLQAVCRWAETADRWMDVRRQAHWESEWEEDGYLRQLNTADTWRIRNAIALALEELERIEVGTARTLARCAVMRTAQWALDMRHKVPGFAEFREKLIGASHDMVFVAGAYTSAVRMADRRTGKGELERTLLLQQAVPGLADHPRLADHPAPDLILTSPPYPGVYVNYHRWKLRGRSETAAPFWVTGCLDGRGLSYYTMSARADKTLDTYFRQLAAAWSDIARLVSSKTWVVQMVGFHDSRSHLQRYLEVMRQAGFDEMLLAELSTAHDGRLWRDVPGRRWWVVAGDRDSSAPHTSREVVLVHRRAE